MEKRLLLTTQKNIIFQNITQLEMNPSDFKFIDGDSREVQGCKVSELVHTSTGYYFTFDFIMYNTNEYWIRYFPTTDGKMGTINTDRWQAVLMNLVDWLKIVKREVTTHNLWDNILEENVTINYA